MDATSAHDPHAPSITLARLISSKGRFLTVVAAYFILQFVARIITSPTVDLDEGEQLLATQQLALGYGPQPPLYTWLQFPLVQLLGARVLPLALLKNILLFCLYALTYLNTRLVTRSHWLSVAATVSLLFIPQIVWESQRDLTHSVLVTVCAAATFHVALQLRRESSDPPECAPDSGGRAAGRLAAPQSLKWFFALGLCMGCGVLSKYNYLVFLAGLVGAVLIECRWRRVFVSRGGLVALAVFGVVIAPHVTWVLANRNTAMATASKLEFMENVPRLVAMASGSWNLALSVLYFSITIVTVYGVVSLAKPTLALKHGDLDSVRLITKALMVMLGILLTGIFLLKATGFKDRWFSPLLIWLPILFVAKLQSRLEGKRVARLIVLAFVVGTGVLVTIPARVHFAAKTNQPQRHNFPYEALVQGVKGDQPPRVIVAENNFVGGNMKRCFPKAFVFTPLAPLRPASSTGDECLVVWDATKADLPGSDVMTRLQRFVEVDWSPTNLHYASAPMLHYPEKEARLGFSEGRLK